MRFGRPYSVIRRAAGGYVNGTWVPATEPAAVTVKLDIQPTGNAYSRMLEALPEGRRNQETRVAYAPSGTGLRVADPATSVPGDIVLINSKRWLVVAAGGYDNLAATSATRHDLYLLQAEIEKAAGESPT